MGSVRSDQKAAPLAVTFRCAGGAKAHVGAEAIRRGRVAGKSVLVPVVNVIDVWWVGVVGAIGVVWCGLFCRCTECFFCVSVVSS